MRYNPGLDTIRALAALAVVLMHAEQPGWAGGYLGVDVFFVLSGYLITRLLVENRPTIGQFYLRRAKRLYPALLTMLAFVAIVGPLTTFPEGPKHALLAALYLTDYVTLHPSWLNHTWSLSVEEHFYLLWPPILYYALKRCDPKNLPRYVLSAAVYLLVWRLTRSWFIGWFDAYYYFDTHATGLALGCALALYRWEAPKWAGWLGVGIVAGAMVSFPIYDGARWGITVAEIGAALMIAGGWSVPVFVPQFAYLGRLSYGIYLWHFPVLAMLDYSGWHLERWQRSSITIIASIAIAALSYHTVEAWFKASRSKPSDSVPSPASAG